MNVAICLKVRMLLFTRKLIGHNGTYLICNLIKEMVFHGIFIDF